jgi:transposase, IS30 family
MQAIARALNRSPNTISSELKIGKVNGIYDPKKAQHNAYVRRRNAKFQGRKIVAHKELRGFVEKSLMEGRSPNSIAGRINRHEKHLPTISADSIERFLKSVYGRRIEVHRKKLEERRRKHRRRIKVTKLKDRTFIDKRPKIITKRGRVGDAEADFIVSGKSGKGYLLTVSDRKLRASFLEKILPVSILNMEKAFLRIKRRYPEMRTITTDNDLLFEHHKRLEKLLDVKIYFCHPYHSWEKGSIENVNGEIRKHIPKGSNISKYSKYKIKKIEKKLNDRYMECLNFSTPQEALDRHRKRKKRTTVRHKKKK